MDTNTQQKNACSNFDPNWHMTKINQHNYLNSMTLTRIFLKGCDKKFT